jgi:diguanylate cyclase (GGDEF)-like protein
MAAMVTTARKSSVRLLRTFTIGAVIALVATVGLAALGIDRVYYAHVGRTAEMHAQRLADTLVRAGRVSSTPPLVPATDAGRAALDARLRHDLVALGLAEITLFDRDGREVYSTARRGAAPAARAELARALAGETVSEFVQHRAGDGTIDGLVSYLPLRDGVRLLGGVRVVTDVNPARAEFARVLAVSIAVALVVLGSAFGVLFVIVRAAAREVEAAHHDLETMAVTDVVNGLANRRYLMARAAEECARIPRQRGRDPAKAGVGFIMADIDAFKTVNDTHGHLAGDDVLRAVADRIRRVTRRYDIVGRYGGDEFLVVVPGTDFDETGSVAERVWQIVREESFAVSGATVPVTVSVGYTCADGDDVNAALRRADDALYRAKHGGRDRVIAL